MALKPNYGYERTQRARTREMKKQDKQRRREEASSSRKSLQPSDPDLESAARVTSGDTSAEPH